MNLSESILVDRLDSKDSWCEPIRICIVDRLDQRLLAGVNLSESVSLTDSTSAGVNLSESVSVDRLDIKGPLV